MALEYQIYARDPNGIKTHSVKLLIKAGAEVRVAEMVLPGDQTTPTPAQIQQAWDAGVAHPKGLRMWAAAQQRQANELLDRTMFEVTVALQAETNLAALLGVGVNVLSEDPAQLAFYNKLAKYFAEADQDTRNKFTALALVVAIGKLGQ